MERARPALEAYEALCDELGSPPAEVGLAWLLQQPGVTAPIVGPRTTEQLESALSALEVRLDDATLARLDEIFPGPGRPAPGLRLVSRAGDRPQSRPPDLTTR
jgi:aryl-alcohol dehydrogenase-like predicted oxidoreductase